MRRRQRLGPVRVGATGTGAGSARPACSSPTARGSCCSTARRGRTRAAPGRCPAARATATRMPSPPRCARPPRRPTSIRPPRAVRRMGRRSRRLVLHHGRRAPAPPDSSRTRPTPRASRSAGGPIDDVAGLPLHHGFAAAWPPLRRTPDPLTIVIDPANVIGSSPDGWWRDRLGAARRLREPARPGCSRRHRPARSLPDGVSGGRAGRHAAAGGSRGRGRGKALG